MTDSPTRLLISGPDFEIIGDHVAGEIDNTFEVVEVDTGQRLAVNGWTVQITPIDPATGKEIEWPE